MSKAITIGFVTESLKGKPEGIFSQRWKRDKMKGFRKPAIFVHLVV